MRRILLLVGVLTLAITGTGATWSTDHGDNRRSGYQPGGAAYKGLSIAFSTHLDGAVQGSPILIGSAAIVATENDSVYSLDANTGRVRWYRHLANPAPTSALACSGNISPSGITGSPAYDPSTGRVFVVTNSVSAGVGAHHEIWGLSANTSKVYLNRRLTVPGTAENAEQQRGALAVSNGNVFIPFGGLDGDCGQYKGAVISLKANGVLGATTWVVPTAREGGIWATGGPVVAADGSYYVAIGNGASTSGAYDGSDSVTRISANSKRLDYFAPSNWASDNAGDLDLGSMTPALTADGYILQAGKSGTAYVLRQSSLGGIGHQVSSGPLCRSFGVAAVTGSTVYVPCTGGVSRVEVHANGTFTKAWTAQGGIAGSPVIGPGALYSVSGGRLYAIWPRDGRQLGSVSVGATARFATPALWSNKAYVPTNTGLVAVRIS